MGQMTGLLGNNEPPKEQSPPQVANNTGGGVGNMFTGISNQMFKGMSQEQVARLGMGFNSMTLRPDDNLARSFQSTIDSSKATAKATATRNATVDWLRTSVSKKYPNGRTDLIDMVLKGILSPTAAVDAARTESKPSLLTEKFNKLQTLTDKYGSYDKIPAQYKKLLNVSADEATFIQKWEFYQDQGGTKSYDEYLTMNSPGTTISIGDKEENAFWTAMNAAAVTEITAWSKESGDSFQNIVKLKDALKALQDPNQMLTGAIIGQMPDFFQAFLNPKAIDVRESVESVVQRNLKAVLGAQFTEKEGERLIKRAYNPTLSPEINARRLGLLIEQMESSANMQQARYDWMMSPESGGSMRGFTGEMPTFSDFWTILSRNQIGDVICDNGVGTAKQCYEYIGGDDADENSYKLTSETK